MAGGNGKPDSITVSNLSVAETLGGGSAFATVAATDPDGDTPLVTLVSDDSGLFVLAGTELRLKSGAALDFETDRTHQLVLRATDAAGASIDRAFKVQVTDVNDEVPFGLVLSANTIDENAKGGAKIGRLTADDADRGDVLTYEVVGDSADMFEVVGRDLRLKDGVTLDFETDPSVNVSLRVTDLAGNNLSQAFRIGVQDVNEAPTDIGLRGASISEKAPGGTVVGYVTGVDPDGDALAFDASGGKFEVKTVMVGGEAKTALVLLDGAKLDHDSSPEIAVTIRARDPDGRSYAESFTIDVTDANGAPTKIAFKGGASARIAENSKGGAVVGRLVTTDPDAADTFSYKVVTGDDLFTMKGDQLVVKRGAALDFEDDKSPEVSVRVTDSGGESHVQKLKVILDNVNEAPTAVVWANGDNTADELKDSAYSFGFDRLAKFATIDPDKKDKFSYELLKDYGRFEMKGDGLYLMPYFGLDFEDQSSYDLVVKATDANGKSVVSTLTFNVADINEDPRDLQFASGGSVAEDARKGDVVGRLTAFDPDAGDALTYEVLDDRFTVAGDKLVVKSNGALRDVGARYMDDKFVTVVVTAMDGGGRQTLERLDIGIVGVADFLGGNGAETKTAPSGAAVVDYAGFGGNDSLTGADGDDRLFGGAGNDTLKGLVLSDLLDGGTGIDSLVAGGGNDTLVSADGGPDSLDGGTGNFDVAIVDWSSSKTGIAFDAAIPGGDTLHKASDGLKAKGVEIYVLNGSKRDDVIRTGEGNDTIIGEGGLDSIDGGGGNDSLSGFEGRSTINGGDGDDFISTTVNRSVDLTIDGGKGADSLLVTVTEGGKVDLAKVKNVESISVEVGEDATVTGSSDADYFIASSTATIAGGGGNDYFKTDGRASIDGGAGADRVELNLLLSDRDEVSPIDLSTSVVTSPLGGVYKNIEGYTVDLGALSYAEVQGSAGDDAFTGSKFYGQIDGGAGQDDITTAGGTLSGGAGGDSLTVTDFGGLAGDAGDDYLYSRNGGGLDGGAGADTIVAGGFFTMTGGAGRDVFAFGPNVLLQSSITDFTHGEDKLWISDLLGVPSTLNVNLSVGNNPTPDGRGVWVLYDTDDNKVLIDYDGTGKKAAEALLSVSVLSGTFTKDDLL